MRDEFLAKLQGSSRTFVIQSNTNPHAAAAMAGMMAARIQEAGPYFRISDRLLPIVDGRAVEDINTASSPDQLDTDFKGDWIAYLRSTGLPGCGLR